MDAETIAISLEDVADLRRMHRRQFDRLVEAKAHNDGPAAGAAMREIIESHVACDDLFTVIEYLLSERALR